MVCGYSKLLFFSLKIPNAISHHLWGEKQSYDICLDSDLLSREKCAEILIEAASDCKLDLEECAQIIKSYFDWTR